MADENFDVKLARSYSELNRRKKELEEELLDVKRQITATEPQLLDQFARAGIRSIPVGGMTVYLHRDVRARVVKGSSKEEACRALVEAGFSEFVEPGFNFNSVSALFREMDKEGHEMPPELKGKLEPIELFSVRARRSGSA